jgi:hypothetical protein
MHIMLEKRLAPLDSRVVHRMTGLIPRRRDRYLFMFSE